MLMNIQSLDFWESTFVLLHLTRKPRLVSFLSVFLFQNFFYPFSVPAAGIHLLSNGQGLRVWAIKTSSSKCMYFGHQLIVLTWGQCSLEPPSILMLSLANLHHSRGTSPTVLWLRKGVSPEVLLVRSQLWIKWKECRRSPARASRDSTVGQTELQFCNLGCCSISTTKDATVEPRLWVVPTSKPCPTTFIPGQVYFLWYWQVSQMVCITVRRSSKFHSH